MDGPDGRNGVMRALVTMDDFHWTIVEDVANLLNLAGYDVVRHCKHVLLPARVPLVATFANHYLAHLRSYGTCA